MHTLIEGHFPGGDAVIRSVVSFVPIRPFRSDDSLACERIRICRDYALKSKSEGGNWKHEINQPDFSVPRGCYESRSRFNSERKSSIFD